MDDLTCYKGRRIEIEIEDRRCLGRVIRGPARQVVFLEERGNMEDRSDIHRRLGACRIWSASQLRDAKLVRVLDGSDDAPRTRHRDTPSWGEVVALAEADPAIPPSSWKYGMLAWAEAVYSARRKVDRGRKAMLQALREAAG